jgi:hypothetical protein
MVTPPPDCVAVAVSASFVCAVAISDPQRSRSKVTKERYVILFFIENKKVAIVVIEID